MALEIRLNMFMVGKSTSQFGDVGMFKRIIPGNLFTRPVDFVTVIENTLGIPIDKFPDIQSHSALEDDLALDFG